VHKAGSPRVPSCPFACLKEASHQDFRRCTGGIRQSKLAQRRNGTYIGNIRINLPISCRIMLLENLCAERGPVSGSFGTIKDIRLYADGVVTSHLSTLCSIGEVLVAQDLFI
jgi:hypothetical protein